MFFLFDFVSKFQTSLLKCPLPQPPLLAPARSQYLIFMHTVLHSAPTFDSCTISLFHAPPSMVSSSQRTFSSFVATSTTTLSLSQHLHNNLIFIPTPPQQPYLYPNTSTTTLSLSQHLHNNLIFIPTPPQQPYLYPNTSTTTLSLSQHLHNNLIFILPPWKDFYDTYFQVCACWGLFQPLLRADLVWSVCSKHIPP